MDKFKFNEIFDDDTHNVTKIPKNEYKKSGIIPIIDQGKEFIAGYTDYCKSKKIESTRIIFGDHTRIIKFVDFEAYIGADGVKVLKIKNKNADYKYMYYYLKKSYIPDTGYNRHYKWLKELKFVLPSIEKQKVIATKLDKVQEIIDIREKQIEQLDNLIKSQFVEMFENRNYEKLSGKELFSFSSGKFLEASKRLENGVPVYGGNGVAWYTDDPLIDFNTIVIGRVGAYCGNVKLIKEPVWITDNAIFIKQFKKDVYNIDFLYYMMELVDFSRFAQFSGQPKITQKPLEEFNYVVPPIEEQIKFSNIVKQIDKQKFEIQKSLEETQKLQDSLMNKYFS